jgi:ABC-type multidrug transport system ATPase subunit
LYLHGQRIKQHRLASGDTIRVPGQNEHFVILTYLDESIPSARAIDCVQLNREIQIGRSPHNQLTLPDPLVSAFHAVISPTPNGHLLRDLNSSNGTYVNGQRIQQATLQPNAIIQLGSTQLRYTGSELMPARMRQEGIRLDAVHVHKRVKLKKASPNAPDFKVLIDDVSLSILPREFVAIVGGSGTGKSTMLDALNGFRPAKGQVLLNGDNLYQNFDAYRHTIGYVPQDDIIHRELTVAEALRYVAHLRLPSDSEPEEIEQRIDAVLEQMAMSERKNLFIKDLSGGQRKRVSIAVELIADPGIIFLDEPTSGLDPGLDKKMMFTLRQVANAGKTVILVTHATGNIVECHLVTFLAAGGRLVFFGPPQDALTFFGVNDFAEIYHLVEQEPERWIQTFKASQYYQMYVQQRLAEATSRGGESTSARKSGPSWGQQIKNSVRQCKVLTQRNLTMLFRDRRNLLFLLLQAPVIGLLLFFVIDADLFAQVNINVRNVDARELVGYISDIQKMLFMLACTGTWFGVINAIREIVKELPIYRRERLVNMSIPAYVFSKLIVLLGLSLVQALTLILLVHLRGDFPSAGIILPGLVEIFVTMTLVIFTSACFGLFLSAVVGREDRVMSIMPLFLIPQIVFAGIVFTFEKYTPGWLISQLTFSRWGVEALGATINLHHLWEESTGRQPMEELPLDFTHSSDYLLQNWGILLGFAALGVALTLWALKRQDVN